ncbi:MAG TPA: WD40 repeat domain-containing protein [Terriglobia bacterium]|nr:WD40 repeat domain-containing protein [Terriglobia bacterium]
MEGPKPAGVWSNRGNAEGHLALAYSPAGAFSPDSSQLAIVNGSDIALMDLKGQGIVKVHPLVKGVISLDIESANFLAPGRLLVLCRGEIASRSQGGAAHTPELALRWDLKTNAAVGPLQSVNAKGEYGLPRWFPDIRYLVMNKENTFELWNPESGAGGKITVPPLTRSARLFAFSPDGRWLLLAQIESSSRPDPIVVRRSDNQFDNALKGHTATVLSLAFSRDSARVATACEDGKVRIFSTARWALEHTLEGHSGPVHWAEFSPDGQWVVSAGEDKTVRVWSAESGELVQTLAESKEPVLTVAFSPDSHSIAASTSNQVLIWQRSAGL